MREVGFFLAMARSYAPPRCPSTSTPRPPLAPRALLPGDPGRALLLAQLLTSEPKMFNHNRGLWGYTGIAADGEPLTIQSTGMGGPSAAIVLEELCDLGLRRAIRVGTCGALDGDLALGDLVVADAALARRRHEPRARRRRAGRRRRRPRRGAARRGRRAARASARSRRATSSTTAIPRALARGYATGALAVEMEAAALLRVGELRGVAVALPARGDGRLRRRRRAPPARRRRPRAGRRAARAASPPRRSRASRAASRRAASGSA